MIEWEQGGDKQAACGADLHLSHSHGRLETRVLTSNRSKNYAKLNTVGTTKEPLESRGPVGGWPTAVEPESRRF